MKEILVKKLIKVDNTSSEKNSVYYEYIKH